MSNKAPRVIQVDLSIARSPENGLGINIPEKFIQLVFNRGTDKDSYVDVLVDATSGNFPSRYFNRDILDGGYDREGKSEKIDGCTIYNDAQAGKVLYIEIHTSTRRVNGSLISDTNVELILPTAGLEELIGITTGGVVQILSAADITLRKRGISNRLGYPLYVKFDNNNNLTGRLLQDGDYMETENQGNIYALCANAVVAVPATGVGINITKEY